jgi:cytochrome c
MRRFDVAQGAIGGIAMSLRPDGVFRRSLMLSNLDLSIAAGSTRRVEFWTRVASIAVAGVALVGTAAHAASKPDDPAMLKLAVGSGCMTCHSVEPGRKGPDGMNPIGPAWQDVATKYRGNGKALGELTRTVMKGSSPYESHWKGQVSGLAMPPNAVAITEPDARRLVKWILELPKP